MFNEHFFLLIKDKWYGFGDSHHGELGIRLDTKENIRYEIPNPDNGGRWIALNCGNGYTIGLASIPNSNKLVTYSFGSNMGCKLGIQDVYSTGSSSTPLILSISDGYFIEINCGKNFTFAKTSKDQFYCWGVNDHGQLGLGYETCVPVPTLFEKKKGFYKKIFCGNDHTIAISHDNRIYGFGNNGCHQLGLKRIVKRDHESRKVPTLIICPLSNYNEFFVNFILGNLFTVGLTQNGNLYYCGFNYHTMNYTIKNQYTKGFTKFQFKESETYQKLFSAGRNYFAVQNSGGEIIMVGDNEQGQLGAEREFKRGIQYHNFPKVENVYCSYWSTLVLTQDKRYFAFGANYEGILGLENETYRIYTPTELKLQNGMKVDAIIKRPKWDSIKMILIAHRKNSKSVWFRVPLDLIKEINSII